MSQIILVLLFDICDLQLLWVLLLKCRKKQQHDFQKSISKRGVAHGFKAAIPIKTTIFISLISSFKTTHAPAIIF